MNTAERSEHYQQLYRAALEQSARDSESLLRQVFVVVRRALLEAAARATDPSLRESLRVGVKTLDDQAPALCVQFPQLLRQSFQHGAQTTTRLDPLVSAELPPAPHGKLDESQSLTQETARLLQVVLRTVQASLAELGACLGTLQGQPVTLENHPLRPQVYLTALLDLLAAAALPLPVRLCWIRHIGDALGEGLRVSYSVLVQRLKSYGIKPVAESVTPPAAAAEHASVKASALTLERLRDLLAGHGPAMPNVADDEAVTQFAGSMDWEDKPAKAADDDFPSTVPAALEALQDMHQAEEVVARVARHRQLIPSLPIKSDALRQQLIDSCHHASQILSIEVMAQMLDNLVLDERLLEPIRQVIKDLEPALLRLVLVDVRFFSDKQHPARQLLEAITQRGLAFSAADTPEFLAFLDAVRRYAGPLARLQVDSAEPFALALHGLTGFWQQQAQQSEQGVQQAVDALRSAEDRNLLAEKMVAAMAQIPDMQRVPAAVVDFLCGPWAQVMAYAALNLADGTDDPGQYKAVVNQLLWSAQPEQTRGHVAKLTKLVPRLLSKLREGLRLIDYPSLKTSAFFDILIKLHQQAFKPTAVEAPALPSGLAASLRSNPEHWVAPAEAKASGFMEFPEPAPTVEAEPPALLDSVLPLGRTAATSPVPAVNVAELKVGTWVEIQLAGAWQRFQLTWISPQSTMYLFTSTQGNTQSMARHSLDKLANTRILRVLAQQSMVDNALDAVVQNAMRTPSPGGS